MFVLPLSRSVQTHARQAVAPQLTRALDRLLDDSFDRYVGGSTTGTRTPALDVVESDNAYTLVFDVPGASREQLIVSVAGRRVTVESVDVQPASATGTADLEAAVQGNGVAAESANPKEPTASAQASKPAAPRVLYRERNAARYARTVSLPSEVDQSASQARFENGVLTLTLAKRVPTGAVRLSIS